MTAPWIVLAGEEDREDRAGTRAAAGESLSAWLNDQDGETEWLATDEELLDACTALVVDRVVCTRRAPLAVECEICEAPEGSKCRPDCDSHGDHRTVVQYEIRRSSDLANELASLLASDPELRAAVEHQLASVPR